MTSLFRLFCTVNSGTFFNINLKNPKDTSTEKQKIKEKQANTQTNDKKPITLLNTVFVLFYNTKGLFSLV